MTDYLPGFCTYELRKVGHLRLFATSLSLWGLSGSCEGFRSDLNTEVKMLVAGTAAVEIDSCDLFSHNHHHHPVAVI